MRLGWSRRLPLLLDCCEEWFQQLSGREPKNIAALQQLKMDPTIFNVPFTKCRRDGTTTFRATRKKSVRRQGRGRLWEVIFNVALRAAEGKLVHKMGPGTTFVR